MPFQSTPACTVPCSLCSHTDTGTRTRRQVMGLMPSRRTLSWTTGVDYSRRAVDLLPIRAGLQLPPSFWCDPDSEAEKGADRAEGTGYNRPRERFVQAGVQDWRDAPPYPCGTVRRLGRLASEGGVAVSEKRDDVMPLGDQEVRRQVPLRVGLSPTVERMFGALVDSTDEADGDGSAELEAKGAPQPDSP